MKQAIELHDSELSDVSFFDDSAIVSLSPAYVHRFSDSPGSSAHSGWSQPATFTFIGAPAVPVPASLPAWVSDGVLRIGDVLHDNLIPASGSFDGPVEFSVVLSTAEQLTIRALRVSIQLHGEATYIEECKP